MPEAIRDVWRIGRDFWQETALLFFGLEKTNPELVLEVAPTFVSVARAWEYRIAKLEMRARNQRWLERDDLEVISACDRALRDCTRYFPVYSLLPQTTARLL